MHFFAVKNFAEWRKLARDAITRNILPQDIQWNDQNATQNSLFEVTTLPPVTHAAINVPKDFIQLAERVACHTDPQRWHYLYQALWRILFEEKNLLKIASDPLVHQLHLMNKAIGRDAHKTKAFVRFYKSEQDGQEHYIAWHNPDYDVLRLVAPFFQRRFAVMQWTIMTPFETVHWDGNEMHFSAGVARKEAPDHDSLEQMWQTYYRSTFNPARIKIKAMKREMPVRHWKTLPETNLIPSMLKEAEQRVATMLAHQEGLSSSATLYLPQDQSIPSLRKAAEKCQACPLYKCASRVVFGIGPENARIMIVGEQPGDQEDQQGIPFIGPAGLLLNQALKEVGLPRENIYLTNAVKHFGFTLKGDLREHVSPKIPEINACKPWLEAEIAAVKPDVILCLGLTAARAVTGMAVKMRDQRGKWFKVGAQRVMISYHPSAILRQPDDAKANEIYQQLTEDLRNVMAALHQ